MLLSPTLAVAGTQSEESNKALARRFYEQVWFTRNLTAVDELVAPYYLVHDVGDRKSIREPADEQKQAAEFFWQKGTMSGQIDFQIAEGDLVATRWQWQYRPTTWLMKLTMVRGRNPVPIINVFRFKDGQDGRTVGFADYGTPDQTPVLWCHGGPGCRYEPDLVASAAERAGLRLVGIDRPGYGRSTPNPGRTIGAWVQEALPS